jgi:3-oxoacyl-[acyl-carrier protein] reductase
MLRGAGVDLRTSGEQAQRWRAILFDATAIDRVPRLDEMRAFIAPAFRSLGPSGRLLLFGIPPETCREPEAAAVQRALDGFMRSAAKEARAGSTVNVL